MPKPPKPTPVPRIDIEGDKIWDDEDNAHRTRPSSIVVELLANGVMIDTQIVTGSGNRWTYSFTNLPEYDDNGERIEYTVREIPVAYYQATISGYQITNRLIPQEPERYIDLFGEKIWNDKDNESGKRPTSVTVRLLRDGVEIDSRVVTAGTNWGFTFQHLPVDDGYGNIYTYEIREDGVNGYFTRINGATVTNSLIDGSVPPTPSEDDETPTPDGDIPTGPEDIPERRSGTPVPPFDGLSDEELEERFNMFGYGTPLYSMLGTGDIVPAWIWICGSCGLLSLALAILLGRRKKRIN